MSAPDGLPNPNDIPNEVETGEPHGFDAMLPLGLVLGLVDLIGPAIVMTTPSMLLAAIFGGFLMGQFAALSIIAVLGPGRWLPRWLAVVGAEAVVLLLTLAPARLPPHAFVEVFGCLPLVSLLGKVPFVPLWFARLDLVWGYATRQEPTRRQFSLAHVFALLTFAAVALSLVSTSLGGRAADWGTVAVFSVMAFAVSLLVGLPGVLLGLLVDTKWLLMPILFPIIPLIAVVLADKNTLLPLWLTSYLTALGTVVVTMRVFRAYGFKARRRRTVGPVVVSSPAEPASPGSACAACDDTAG